MALLNGIWDKYLTNDIYKRKKYEENSVYFNNRDFKTLTFFALSQMYYSKVGHKSGKKEDLLCHYTPSYDEVFEKIDKADIVSFDIFDTLIFRCVSKPTDLYYFVEKDIEIPDFKRIRIQAEKWLCEHNDLNKEAVTCETIYDRIREMNGDFYNADYRIEEETEMNICFANDSVLPIYEYAKKAGKQLICVSDMYHSSSFLSKLLLKNGFEFDKIFVSCEMFCNKRSGELQKKVKEIYKNYKILHIGDNTKSDISNSKAAGFDTFLIKNVNAIGHNYRAYIDYNFQGSVYSAIVNSKLFSGLMDKENEYYKFGYIYSGILTLGFVDWLYDSCLKNNDTKILFLGRDCEVIKEVFDKRYSDIADDYFETSRTALYPVMANVSFDYFLEEAFSKRFFVKKYSIQKTFESVGLKYEESFFADSTFNSEQSVSREKWPEFKEIMYKNKDTVIQMYSDKLNSFDAYLENKIKDFKSLLIVDLGWRGSSIVFLKKYISGKFPDVIVSGAMLGSSDVYLNQNYNSDLSIKNYLFSPFENISQSKVDEKELLISDKRFFLEYVYTSEDNSVVGYSLSKDKVDVIKENKDVSGNNAIISDIHRGINDFIDDYILKTGKYNKSIKFGSDISYMPMFKFMKRNSLKTFFKDFVEDECTIHNV